MAYALGAVRPHVRVAAEEVGAKFGVKIIYGIGVRAGKSDHPAGLALDYMVGTDRAKGDAIATYMMQNASRLGVKYLIWKQKIWQGGAWKPMEDRGSLTANHFDHVHASFMSAGAGIANAGFDNPFSIPDLNGFSIPDLDNPFSVPKIDGIEDIKNALGAIGNVLGWLANPHNWYRLALILGGIALLFLGLIQSAFGKTAVTTARKVIPRA